MDKKPIVVQRKDGTKYYAWNTAELSARLKLLMSLNFDAHRYYNHYLQAKEKGKEHEMQYNMAMLKNTKEMIDAIKNELMKDHWKECGKIWENS